MCYRVKNYVDFSFPHEAIKNPEGNRIWLYQRMELLRRKGILKELLHLTVGKSHCYRDLMWPYYSHICGDLLLMALVRLPGCLIGTKSQRQKCNINVADISCLM